MRNRENIKGEGVILRRVSLNESDQIITVLSPDLGRVGLFARGSRKLKSKFCGQLESLSRIRFSAFAGKDLLYLDEAETIGSGALMDCDLKGKSILFLIAEVTGKLVHEGQESHEAYRLLTETLDCFGPPAKHDLILYAYLIKLLTELGFMAEWDRCARSGDRLDLHTPLYLSQQDASVVKSGYQSAGDPRLTPSLIKWVNFMQKSPMEDLLRVNPSPGEQRQVWFVVQCLFQGLLSYPLKSEGFLNLVK